jgi:hypothetical protein
MSWIVPRPYPPEVGTEAVPLVRQRDALEPIEGFEFIEASRAEYLVIPSSAPRRLDERLLLLA